MTWPVTQGLITKKNMDEMVRLHHKSGCSVFDGGHANRMMPAGRLTETDRNHHEVTIASVMDVMRQVKVWIPVTENE